MEIDPAVPQVACFDTAFHRGHPAQADCYALPRALYDEGVRRYGFHGLSYEYVAGRLREVAPEIAGGRVIVAHLGSGASMCALRDGRSIESTMGFTALDGLPMGTRPGQLDPGVVLYLFAQRGMSAGAGLGPALQGVRPQGPLGRLERHARPARERRPARRLRHRPFRPPLARSTPACWRPRSAASTPSSSPPASARTRRRSAPASPSGSAGSALELDPAANEAGAARISTPDEPRRPLRHPDRRGADDRAPHARARQPRAGP